jgi:hypothetical protein
MIAVLGMVLWAAPAAAQKLYKWVDERGVTHYSEKPPADKGAPAQLRDVTGSTSTAESQRGARTARNSNGDLQQQEREFQRRQRERDRADERRLQQQAGRGGSAGCRSAQRDLSIMESNSKLYTFDALARARDRAASACR